VNLAASIQFGQMVERHWKNLEQTDENMIVIHENEKQCVRENLMQCIY